MEYRYQKVQTVQQARQIALRDASVIGYTRLFIFLEDVPDEIFMVVVCDPSSVVRRVKRLCKQSSITNYAIN